MATDPPLSPAYDPLTPDYTVACTAGDPVEATLDVPPGARVRLDGNEVQGGTSVHGVDLSPGQAFRVSVEEQAATRTHLVRCVPPDLPRWTVERAGPPQARWYVFVTSLGNVFGRPYVVVADAWGVPVWWMHYPGRRPIDAKILPDGRLAIAPGSGGGYSTDARYEIRTLDGALAQEVGTGLDFHDLQQMPNGNFLVMAYVRRDADLSSWGAESDAVVLDAELRELTPAGDLVWLWNSGAVIDLAESERHKELIKRTANTLPDGRKQYDIVHINSLEPDGDGVVISLRFADAVYRIRRSDGAVDWKIGGTTRPESLTLLDDPLASERLGDQHDARVLSDGSVTIHDNAQLRSRPPEALRYELDTVARTATLIERIRDPRVPQGGCCGSTRKLSGGNWLTYWGGTQLIAEQQPDGTPVLTMRLPNGVFSYRADPAETGPSRDEMRAGMDAMFPRP